MRERKLSISTTITEDEIRDRLLREHLVDIGALDHEDDPIPSSINHRITRPNGAKGGYRIETWQNRVPRVQLALLPPATDGGDR
ncbi:hypothetical protein HKCCE4037_06605 [Rhodobacterales bacterium HKCCE4037]|nr:hypothetical protein [Rhodobacterales bacterium HKCCE4037]